jgi:hypothetical protein
MHLVAGCVMEGSMVLCQKNILEHSKRFHGDYINRLWKDTVHAIRDKFGWIQCLGTKPLLINLSLSTFRCFEGQATS